MKIQTRNVREYTDNEGKLLKKAIVVTFEDNGPGIPSEIKARIFDDGFSTKHLDGGKRGYGLGIVKDFIQLNNGTLTIDSPIFERNLKENTSDSGTRFTLIFNKNGNNKES